MVLKRWRSPRFGALDVCLPPCSLKKPRPKDARAFLVPKLSSFVVFALVGEEEPHPALLTAWNTKKQKHRLNNLFFFIKMWFHVPPLCVRQAPCGSRLLPAQGCWLRWSSPAVAHLKVWNNQIYKLRNILSTQVRQKYCDVGKGPWRVMKIKTLLHRKIPPVSEKLLLVVLHEANLDYSSLLLTAPTQVFSLYLIRSRQDSVEACTDFNSLPDSPLLLSFIHCLL